MGTEEDDSMIHGLFWFVVVILAGSVVFRRALPVWALWLVTLFAMAGSSFHLAVATRWQFIPTYAFVGVAVWIIGLEARRGRVSNVLRGLALILLVVSGLLHAAFPMYSLPRPSGDRAIGTVTYTATDSSRIEAYDDSGEPRRFKYQVWYPAATTTGLPLAPWIGDGVPVTQSLASDWGFPSFILSHTAAIPSHSYMEAPLERITDQYPVVILSHGWSGFRSLHADLAEELASLGFVVVGIEHTYGSLATVFLDDIAYLNRAALPPRESTPTYLDFANRLVRTYAGDIHATLDALEGLHNDSLSMFFDQLQLDQVTVIGHSTGGGAAVAAANEDERIARVVGLDAWVEPLSVEDRSFGLLIPSLFVRSQGWEISRNNAMLQQVVNDSPRALFVQVDGTTHYDFATVYMYSPLTRPLGITGSLSSSRLSDLMKHLVREFIIDDDIRLTMDVFEEVQSPKSIFID